MSAARIHLIRHGEVDNPHHVVYADLPGYGLSATGRSQAADTGEYLAGAPITCVISSPLLRARQTAAAIAGFHGLEIEVDARLTEWGGGVRWGGVGWEQLDAVFPGELTAYLEEPLNITFGPESLQECGRRAAGAIRDWTERIESGEAVVVSHQDTIHAARLELTGAWRPDYHAGKPEHASVITVVPAPGDWEELKYWAPTQGEPFPPVD